MQKICTKHAWNMLKYAYYMPSYVINVQLYALNMQKICKYMDCIGQICKTICSESMRKYAVYMHIIRRSLYIAYFAFICTPHFADVADAAVLFPSIIIWVVLLFVSSDHDWARAFIYKLEYEPDVWNLIIFLKLNFFLPSRAQLKSGIKQQLIFIPTIA